MTQQPLDIILEFIACINRHDVAGLTALMADDHVFIDSLGMTVHGKDTMRKAWIAYFFLIPDYTIQPQEFLQRDDTVAVFGTARGTCAEKGQLREQNRWEIPLALKAIVHAGLVAGWQVYADNEPVRKIMSSRPPSDPQ